MKRIIDEFYILVPFTGTNNRVSIDKSWLKHKSTKFEFS